MQRKNFLEALFYGEIAPWEKRFDSSPEYQKYTKTIFDSEEKLTARLNKEERELLDQLTDAEGDLSAFSAFAYFAEGFRLGAASVLDAFVV